MYGRIFCVVLLFLCGTNKTLASNSKILTPYDSQLYVLTCTKHSIDINTAQSIVSLSQVWESINVIIYCQNDAISRNYMISNLTSTTGTSISNIKVHFIDETYFHSKRTQRLAVCRNLLVEKAISLESVQPQQHQHEPLLMMIDTDEINAHPINFTTLQHVLHLNNKWDAISFNRPTYYDIWALRYERFNFNLLNFYPSKKYLNDSEKPVHSEDAEIYLKDLTKMIRFDISRELSTTRTLFYPVLSAFNGISLIKFNVAKGCTHHGLNRERHRVVGEDCEHVSFYKCINNQHNGKVVIYKHPLLIF
jgi:hypothetical protein